ncbi:hypothetical protein DBR27_03790, partial [Flavobacterium sp. HMWF030]
MTNNSYKQTAIGLIPSDWELTKLERIALIDNESLKGTTDPEYEFDYISLSDVDSDSFKIETSRQIFKSAPSRARRLVKKGDILMSTVRPNLQGFSIINNDVKDLIASTGFAVITANNADNHFLYQYIFSNSIQKQFYNLIVGSNYPAINSSDVKHLKIPIPPLPEQQKIASILSTWDIAIDNCKRIIEELKVRNQGIAQNLLTGKMRVKGFETNKWKFYKLGNVTENFSRRNKSLVDARIYSVTNSNGFVLQSDHFSREVAGADLNNYKIIKKDEFAYNPARINVGSIAFFTKDTGVISSLYVCFRTNELVLDAYLFEWLKLDQTIHDINRYGEGGVRVYLWYDLFKNIKINLPQIKEQEVIVN